MSISEQVKELRRKAKIFRESEFAVDGIIEAFEKAADTIESLSAKLQAENCGGGWIPCKDRLPEENEEVICCFKNGIVKALVLFNCKFHGKVYAYDISDIIAWQPLPEPYHEPQ